MRINNFSSGYSKEQYDLQFKGVTPRLLIGQGLEERLKFDQETKRPVESLRAWLFYPGLGVQSLKLPGSYSLPLVSQRFDYKTVPVSVREQLNVLLQLGNISRTTTQFLYPDLDPNGIVIPTGKGTGLIQVIDSEHPYQVLPLLCPTYSTKAGIL